MITAREELFNHLKYLIEKDEAENMIDEYKEEVIAQFYKVYNSNFPHQKWDTHLEKSIL